MLKAALLTSGCADHESSQQGGRAEEGVPLDARQSDRGGGSANNPHGSGSRDLNLRAPDQKVDCCSSGVD